MKDKEICEQLIKWGKGLKTLYSILSVIMFIGGYIIAQNVKETNPDATGTIFITYCLYTIAFIILAFVTELIFNWMSAILKNLSKK